MTGLYKQAVHIYRWHLRQVQLYHNAFHLCVWISSPIIIHWWNFTGVIRESTVHIVFLFLINDFLGVMSLSFFFFFFCLGKYLCLHQFSYTIHHMDFIGQISWTVVVHIIILFWFDYFLGVIALFIFCEYFSTSVLLYWENVSYWWNFLENNAVPQTKILLIWCWLDRIEFKVVKSFSIWRLMP